MITFPEAGTAAYDIFRMYQPTQQDIAERIQKAINEVVDKKGLRVITVHEAECGGE